MNTKEIRDVTQAELDGEFVQMVTNLQIEQGGCGWYPKHFVDKWDFVKFQYRVKPKEKVRKYLWVKADFPHTKYTGLFKHEEALRAYHSDYKSKVIKTNTFIEVDE